MVDYLKRLLIACIIGVCVSLLFLGGKNVQAASTEQNGVTQERGKTFMNDIVQ